MNIYLVRHGQTQSNIEGPTGAVQGQLDVKLNGTGESQAARLAKEFGPIRWEAVYSSALERAIRTAEILVQGRCPVTKDADLNERHCGNWQGRVRSGIALAHGYPDLDTLWMEKGPGFTPPGGEAFGEMVQRAQAAFREITGTHPDRCDILLVSHGGPIRAIMGHVAGLSIEDIWRLPAPANCELHKITL